MSPELWALLPIPGQLAFDWSVPVTPTPPVPPLPQPPVVTGAPAEARTAVRRFIAMLVEVLNGYRPPTHLRRLCRPVEATTIVAQARAAQHRMTLHRAEHHHLAGTRRASHRVATAAARHGRRPDPVAVRGLRLCAPRIDAIEAAAVLVTGSRTWAVAIRVENGPAGWAITVARVL
jgi:hypothetical protein